MFAAEWSQPKRLPAAVLLLWLLAVTATVAPWLGSLSVGGLLHALWAPDLSVFPQVMVHYSWAPRVAIAILIGAGLGLAGAVLQQVLRNPLAEPSTLGVAAGSQLALGIATLYAPAALATSADLIAIAGGLAAAVLVVSLTWRLGFSPVSVVLAGMVITFFLGAANGALLLLHGEYLGNLFIWGAGSLIQNDWSQFEELWPRVTLLSVALICLLRPLQLLQLGSDSAQALGSRVNVLRLGVILLVIVMTACVVSRVGTIAFVGLAAPALARLLGARTFGQRILWSLLIGSGLLLLADTAAQWATSFGDGQLIPTGTMTAILGAPILLLALRSAQNDRELPGRGPENRLDSARRALLPPALFMTMLLVVVIVVSMGWSPTLDGWTWTPLTEWPEAWHWRGPRLLAAAVAGAVLGFAGTLVQRMTGNVMASPEILGITGGAALAMIILSLLGLNPGRGWQLVAGAVGGAAVLLFLFALSRKHRFAGHQLLLGGIAIYIMMNALMHLVLANGGSDAAKLLTWLMGSTWLITEHEALILTGVSAGLIALTALAVRVLSILPLGDASASALGIRVVSARGLLLLLAALLTAAATVVIGPMSFVGLMAPHLARMLGQQTVGKQLALAGLIGATLLALADYLARVMIFPNQLPAGLLAAIVGGVYFLWGMTRQGRQ
ncbi:MAG: Fe(3+)-hydroxamate ABC transporter permease FhuB [Marinobacter sp.]|uniref:Fe(3+)-hydroxamate ABC transporter permease FhuB n=1 Tax=Marinobacter sp. TaxID=50741 RepID=UPI0034A09F22